AIEAGTLADKQVDVALPVHQGAEALGLGLHVEGELRDIDGVDAVALLGEADAGDPLLGGQAGLVGAGGGGGEPAAVATHDLVDDEHARAGAEFGDDIGEETSALL